MSSQFGYVQAVSSGYFTGSRSIVTHLGTLNYVQINLIPRNITGTIAAPASGTVTVSGTNTVAFGDSSFVDPAANTNYSGSVSVYTTYLDPTVTGSLNSMPGDLRGINSSGQTVVLQSYGMMDVELQGSAGQKLQIAAGKLATLTFGIPTALQSNAPATIPMWYFNDTTGKWIQQGTATLQGNTYTGQVSHFTFWCIGVYLQPVIAQAKFVDQNGRPLANTQILVAYSGEPGEPWWGSYTDSSGEVEMYILADEALMMEVMDKCGNMIGGVNAGPTYSNINLGTVTVNIANPVLNVTGTVVDCFNNPVPKGFVKIYMEGLTYFGGVDSGQFSLNIVRCYNTSETMQLTAGDSSSSEQGAMTTATAPAGGGTLNVGQLSACGSGLGQYITMTFGGNTYSVTNPSNSASVNSVTERYGYFSAYSTNQVTPLQIKFSISEYFGIGNYTPSPFLMYDGYPMVIGPATTNSIQISITSVGPVNGFVAGTMSGSVLDSVSNIIYPMTGTFNVLRTN